MQGYILSKHFNFEESGLLLLLQIKKEYAIFQTWYNDSTKDSHINTQESYWEWNILVSNLIVYDPVYTKKSANALGTMKLLTSTK